MAQAINQKEVLRRLKKRVTKLQQAEKAARKKLRAALHKVKALGISKEKELKSAVVKVEKRFIEKLTKALNAKVGRKSKKAKPAAKKKKVVHRK